MVDMIDPWRIILGNLKPEVKTALAVKIKVHPTTVNRWITGENTPRDPDVIRALARHLPKIEPALREVPEFAFAFELPASGDNVQVPVAYAVNSLDMFANVAEFVSQYTIHRLVYENIVSQLDPHKEGLMLLFVQCIPPATEKEKVTALMVSPGRGTGPWNAKQIENSFIIGSGTLCAAVIASGRPAFNPSDQPMQQIVPLIDQDRIHSFGAFPIMRRGEKIAGVLFIASVHHDFFTPARCTLMRTYTNMFSLGLDDNQFYRFDQIEFQPSPSPQQQNVLLQHYHRFIELMRESRPEYKNLPVEELERIAIKKMEVACLE